jgi:excisionase family DNA binding protein
MGPSHDALDPLTRPFNLLSLPMSFLRKGRNALQIDMSPKHLPETDTEAASAIFPFVPGELPLTVREAALYLGVSVQTVYLWVERKQIPHLRVMGRNIRFLKSDLAPFRAAFKQEVGNGKT